MIYFVFPALCLTYSEMWDYFSNIDKNVVGKETKENTRAEPSNGDRVDHISIRSIYYTWFANFALKISSYVLSLRRNWIF